MLPRMFLCWDVCSDVNNSIFVFSFQDGWSALMLASLFGHTEIVKYLIEAKASLDLQKQVYCAQNADDDILYIKF